MVVGHVLTVRQQVVRGKWWTGRALGFDPSGQAALRTWCNSLRRICFHYIVAMPIHPVWAYAAVQNRSPRNFRKENLTTKTSDPKGRRTSSINHCMHNRMGLLGFVPAVDPNAGR